MNSNQTFGSSTSLETTPDEVTIWSALQALVKAYSEPGPDSELVIRAILMEMQHAEVVGELAAIALQYWEGVSVSDAMLNPRMTQYRIRQFDRALEGIQEIVWKDPVWFGGPKGTNEPQE